MRRSLRPLLGGQYAGRPSMSDAMRPRVRHVFTKEPSSDPVKPSTFMIARMGKRCASTSLVTSASARSSTGGLRSRAAVPLRSAV